MAKRLQQYKITLAILINVLSFTVRADWQSHASVEIFAKPSIVWNRIKNFGDLSWTQAPIIVTASSQNRVGDQRTVLSENKTKIVEQLTLYKAQQRLYTYRISEILISPPSIQLSLDEFTSQIRVLPTKTGSLVEWTAQIQNQWLDRQPEKEKICKFIDNFYRTSLENLRRSFNANK